MKNMRRSDRKMDEVSTKELLKRGEFGILSTTDNSGVPYGIPLSYAFLEDKIYLHCAPEGSKLDNIIGNNKVCFTVVGNTKVLPDKFSTEYESAVVFGNAFIISDKDEKVFGLKELVKKYSPDFINEGDEYIQRALEKTAVVRIDIEQLTGKRRA